MYPLEPHFSLHGAFHGKSALSVCANGAFETTGKANFLLGGDSWWYEVQSIEISSATTMTMTTKTIEYLQTEQITTEGTSVHPLYYNPPRRHHSRYNIIVGAVGIGIVIEFSLSKRRRRGRQTRQQKRARRRQDSGSKPLPPRFIHKHVLVPVLCITSINRILNRRRIQLVI